MKYFETKTNNRHNLICTLTSAIVQTCFVKSNLVLRAILPLFRFSFIAKRWAGDEVGKKGVFRNFVKFTGKHLRQSLFFNKVAGLRPAKTLALVLSCKFYEFSKNTFYIFTYLKIISKSVQGLCFCY